MSDDQAGVPDRTIADRKIETLLNKIDHSAGRSETDRDVGIEPVVFGYRWSDQPGYRRRCIEAQHATGLCLQHLRGFFGLFDLGKNLNASLVIGPSRFG